MSLTRRSFLGALGAAPAIPPRRRPNIVVFMTDDHGPWATRMSGCGEMVTPNIDHLATGGTRFTRAYAATPVCSPSRMTYMTGLLPSHHGVQDWLIPKDSYGPASRRWQEGKTTYSELLQRAGYRCGMTGKWHMGLDDQAQAGFTYWATIPGGGSPYRDQTFVKNGERVKTTGFKEDAIGDFALEFLDAQRNSRDPFLLLVPFYAPHTPFDYQPEKYRDVYAGAQFSCFPDVPQHPNQNRGLANNYRNRKSMHAYSALITGADANIGRIVERLERMGAREDTLVVFTADQGWNAGHHGVWGKGNGTVPFNMYEESIGVPMAWNQPGRIKAGQQVDALVSNYDFFPTILDFAGVDAPPDSRRPGRSYAPFLTGARPRWRDRLYFEYEYTRAVRTFDRKLVARTSEWPSEFYDLKADPGEARNLWKDPTRAVERKALEMNLHQAFAKLGAPPLADWRKTTVQELTVNRKIGE
jgi:arylsulfatase A-like enzyme